MLKFIPTPVPTYTPTPTYSLPGDRLRTKEVPLTEERKESRRFVLGKEADDIDALIASIFN